MRRGQRLYGAGAASVDERRSKAKAAKVSDRRRASQVVSAVLALAALAWFSGARRSSQPPVATAVEQDRSDDAPPVTSSRYELLLATTNRTETTLVVAVNATTATTTTGRHQQHGLLSLRRPPKTTTCDPFVAVDGGAEDEHDQKLHRVATPPSGFASIDAHRQAVAAPPQTPGRRLLPVACPINFTLATQATPERLWMLKWICRRWPGPVVIAVYTSRVKIVPKEPECGDRVDYRVVAAPADVFARHSAYPVNRLRNLAVERVKTSHFLLCDVDLWPDASLLRRLDALAAASPDLFRDPQRAVVVPAFAREVKTECSSSTAASDSLSAYRMRECEIEAARMPASFAQLKECIMRKECHIFDRYNQDGHGTTDYKAWLRQDATSGVRDVKCFLSNRYEPYVVLAKTAALPRFEEQFTGYGKNKIQNLVHLRYAGWHFSVLPRSFLTHFPHHKSAARMAWESNGRKLSESSSIAASSTPSGTAGASRSRTLTRSSPTTTARSKDADVEHRTKMDKLYRRFLDTLIDVYGSPGDRTDATLLCSSAVQPSSRRRRRRRKSV